MLVGGQIAADGVADSNYAYLYFVDMSQNTITWDLYLSGLSSIDAVAYNGNTAAAIGYDSSFKETLILVRNADSFTADGS